MSVWEEQPKKITPVPEPTPAPINLGGYVEELEYHGVDHAKALEFIDQIQRHVLFEAIQRLAKDPHRIHGEALSRAIGVLGNTGEATSKVLRGTGDKQG